MSQSAPSPSRRFSRRLRLFRFCFRACQARVVHPNEVRTEYPCESEHIQRTKKHTLSVNPDKARQRFKELVMEFDTAGAANRKEAAQQAQAISDFRTEHA